MFDLADPVVAHVCRRVLDQPNPVHVEITTCHGLARGVQPGTQRHAQTDQPTRRRSPHGERGTDLGLDHFVRGRRPRPVGLDLGSAAQKELGDHRQLPFGHHRLTAMEVGHQLDQTHIGFPVDETADRPPESPRSNTPRIEHAFYR